MKTEILTFLTNHWPEISVLIYEIIARLVPTSKNLSLIDLLLKLTGKTLELTQKGVDKTVPNRQKNTLKSFFILAFLLSSFVVNAQLNITAKTLRLKGNNISASDTTSRAENGQLYFNDNTQTLRLFRNNAWSTLGSGGGGGGLTSAQNGLSVLGANAELGGTLIKNTSIAQNGFNLTFSGTGKVSFSPSATLSGLNVGSLAGDPSVLSNGDVWYNSTSQLLKYRFGGFTSTALGTITGLTSGRVPFASSINGQFVDDAGFSFNSTGDILTVGRLVSLSTATLPGINTGSFAGDPSTLVNGDLWYNSTSNKYKLRINANSHEIISSSSAGIINLGSSGSSVTSYEFIPVGTDSNIALRFFNKGNARPMTFGVISSSSITMESTSTTDFSILSQALSDLTIRAGQGSAGTRGANLVLSGGNSGGAGNGYIILNNLPTSAAGLPTGALWNNAGVLSIAP